MAIQYQCPICAEALHQHVASQGYYCDNKHRFERHEHGYWIFALPKKGKSTHDSRQLMRAKRYLLESGIFAPLVEAMAKQIQPLATEALPLTHLNLDCGDGFYIRALADALAADSQIEQMGICEAENAVFAAVKADTENRYFLGGGKKLPFADESFDLVSLVDKPIKGKECLRVLKRGGHLLQVAAGPRHLWQIKQQIYTDLTEKPVQANLPSGLSIKESIRVSFAIDVNGEQALTLLEMTPYAWRVKDKMKKQLLAQSISQLEIDFVVTVATKDEAE